MTAATGFKRLGFAVAAVLLVGVGALALMSFLISTDRVRDAVKAEIRDVTGLDLTLRGEAAVSLFPTGIVSFANVALGDDSTRAPALAAKRLTARLRLIPLFVGRIEIADVALEQPRIDITLGPDGRSNWSGLMVSLARALGPKANRADRETSFSEIRVRDGIIVLRDSAGVVVETLTGVDLALAWPSISKSFAATGHVVWHGEPIDASFSLSDFASALAGDRSGLKLRLTGALLKLAFEGAISVRPTLNIEGTLAADSVSLRDALRWAGQKPLPGGGLGRFALKAKTNVSGGTIALSGVNVELDGNTAEGVLTFATDGRQTLQGTLAADDLDLTPYISTVRLLTANDRNWNEIPIVLDGLAGFDLDLRLSAAKIAIARAKLGRTAIAANLRAGRLTLTVGESQAFGGVIKGSITLAVMDHGADVKSQLQFTDVDLESCLGEMFNIRRVEGRGNMALAIEASGGSVLALTQNMNGSASLIGREGALPRINAEQLLQRLNRRPLSGTGDFRNGRTPFEKLIVTLKIAQGMATIEDARLEAAKVRITLIGSSSIPTRELDLRGTASLFANGLDDAAPAFELPFVVQGSWDDPMPLPDTQSLIERSPAATPLLDALKGRATRETVRSAIEQLTGGGASGAAPAVPPAASEPVATAPQK